MVDLSGVTPAARPIVVAAAAVYRRHSGSHFIGLLLHGSALKGGFIPGCSDVDFQLYLARAAIAEAGQLPLARCLAIQRDLARIDPAPFGYIQCAALSSELPPTFLPPVPGTYLVLAGRLPVAEATEEQIVQAAHRALATLVPIPPFLPGTLLEHGAGRLSGAIRWLCTWVWPTLYQHGRLDLLVNNAWGGYEDINQPPPFGSTPFWEQPLGRWDRMFAAGVRSTFTACRLAVSLMLPQQRGLLVNTSFWDRGNFVTNVPYDVAKAAVNRLAFAMAHELRPRGIAALALSSGMLRSEGWISAAALQAEYEHSTVAQQDWPADSELWQTESTQYIGRAVVALATDPNVLDKSGRTLLVGELARDYGFTDIDGQQPLFHMGA